MKFIARLTNEERQTLEEAYRNHPKFSVRQRVQGILWNAQGYTITQVYRLLNVRRETMSVWFDRWESHGVMGLFDDPRSGRPLMFDNKEQAQFIAYVDENPHQAKQAAARIQEQTGKQASFSTFRRMLKKRLSVETLPPFS